MLERNKKPFSSLRNITRKDESLYWPPLLPTPIIYKNNSNYTSWLAVLEIKATILMQTKFFLYMLLVHTWLIFRTVQTLNPTRPM